MVGTDTLTKEFENRNLDFKNKLGVLAHHSSPSEGSKISSDAFVVIVNKTLEFASSGYS